MKILAYRGKSIVSRLVRWQTRSEYSHIGIELAGGYVIEAWHKGGVQMNQSYRSVHTPGTRVDEFELNPEFMCVKLPNYEAGISFLDDQIGKRYDFGLIAGFLTHGRRREDNDKWICSELAYMAFSKAGLNLLERVPAGEVSPGILVMSPFLKQVGSKLV